MGGSHIEELGQNAIILLLGSFILVLLILAGLLWVGWWATQIKGSVSPYSGRPMMLGVDLALSIADRVNKFLSRFPDFENFPIDFSVAAICRQTGRIFPNCVSKSEIVHLDWTFLSKRCPGNYRSWGSLTEEQQAVIRLRHESLEGFQTEHSSKNPLPSRVEPYYALMKPGPLYVDLSTSVLIGWKIVPGTEFEVLVVQRPTNDPFGDIM